MEAQNTVWRGPARHRWESYLGLLTHSTKKNPVSQRSKGLELLKKPSMGPRGMILGDPWSCIPWDAPGAVGVEHWRPQQSNDVDAIDQDLLLPLSCLLISHPSPVHCVF